MRERCDGIAFAFQPISRDSKRAYETRLPFVDDHSIKYSRNCARDIVAAFFLRETRGEKRCVSQCGDVPPGENALINEISYPLRYDGVYAAAEVRAECLSVSRSSY